MLSLRWVASGLFIVAVPLFLVLTNVRFAASEPRVFEYSFDRYDAEAVSGVSRPQLDAAAREIVSYFQNGDEFLDIRVVIDGEEQPLFNPREVLHMRDVKDLFQLTFRIHEIAFVYIVGYIGAVFLWSRERSLQRLARESIRAGVMTVGLLAVVAASTFVGFDELFRQFHILSFSNDFWQLSPARDHLVQMFPRGFWFEVTLAVGALTIAEGALVALAGYGYLRHLDGSINPRDAPRAAAGNGGLMDTTSR